jgi:hypothetical protein
MKLKPDHRFQAGLPASADAISDAEKVLGKFFSDSYRGFPELSDGAMFDGVRFGYLPFASMVVDSYVNIAGDFWGALERIGEGKAFG